MNHQDILQVIVCQLCDQRGHLDVLSQTSDWDESAKAAYDTASGRQRNMEMAQLEPLVDADAADILLALTELGPSLTVEYLQFRSGAYQLAAHKPLYAACAKFGHPDLSWDDAHHQAATVASLHLKNPQGVVFSGLRDKFLPAFDAFKKGDIGIADLPYLNDRFYMNGIIRNIEPGDPKMRAEEDKGMPDDLRLSRLLFAAACEMLDQGRGSMTVEEELRLCGLVTLACQELPGYSVFDPDWTTDGVTVLGHCDRAVDTLVRRQAHCIEMMADMEDDDRKRGFLAHDQSQLDDMRELRDRVAAYTEHEVFGNPVTLSFRIYDRFETEKLSAILRTRLPASGPRGPDQSLQLLDI